MLHWTIQKRLSDFRQCMSFLLSLRKRLLSAPVGAPSNTELLSLGMKKPVLVLETRKLWWELICKVPNFSLRYHKSMSIKPAFGSTCAGKIRAYLKNLCSYFAEKHKSRISRVELGSKVENWDVFWWNRPLTPSQSCSHPAPRGLHLVPSGLDAYLLLARTMPVPAFPADVFVSP